MAAERKHREMAWFKREKKAIAEATPPEVAPDVAPDALAVEASPVAAAEERPDG